MKNKSLEFQEGQIIFAKLIRQCYWPAIIISSTQPEYQVEFIHKEDLGHQTKKPTDLLQFSTALEKQEKSRQKGILQAIQKAKELKDLQEIYEKQQQEKKQKQQNLVTPQQQQTVQKGRKRQVSKKSSTQNIYNEQLNEAQQEVNISQISTESSRKSTRQNSKKQQDSIIKQELLHYSAKPKKKLKKDININEQLQEELQNEEKKEQEKEQETIKEKKQTKSKGTRQKKSGKQTQKKSKKLQQIKQQQEENEQPQVQQLEQKENNLEQQQQEKEKDQQQDKQQQQQIQTNNNIINTNNIFNNNEFQNLLDKSIDISHISHQSLLADHSQQLQELANLKAQLYQKQLEQYQQLQDCNNNTNTFQNPQQNSKLQQQQQQQDYQKISPNFGTQSFGPKLISSQISDKENLIANNIPSRSNFNTDIKIKQLPQEDDQPQYELNNNDRSPFKQNHQQQQQQPFKDITNNFNNDLSPFNTAQKQHYNTQQQQQGYNCPENDDIQYRLQYKIIPILQDRLENDYPDSDKELYICEVVSLLKEFKRKNFSGEYIFTKDYGMVFEEVYDLFLNLQQKRNRDYQYILNMIMSAMKEIDKKVLQYYHDYRRLKGGQKYIVNREQQQQLYRPDHRKQVIKIEDFDKDNNNNDEENQEPNTSFINRQIPYDKNTPTNKFSPRILQNNMTSFNQQQQQQQQQHLQLQQQLQNDNGFQNINRLLQTRSLSPNSPNIAFRSVQKTLNFDNNNNNNNINIIKQEHKQTN